METAEFSKPPLELSLAAGLPLTITEKGLRELVNRSVEAGFTKGCVFPFRGFESRHDFEAVSNPNFEIVHIMTPWTPHDVDGGFLAVAAGIKGELLRKIGYSVPNIQDGLFPSKANCEWMLQGLLEASPQAKLVSYDVNIQFPGERLLIDIHDGIKLSPQSLRDLAQEKGFGIVFDPTHILAGEEIGFSTSGKPTRVNKDWEGEFKIFSDAGLIEVVDINPTPQEEDELLASKGLWKEITQAAKEIKVGYLRVEIPLHPHWTVNGLRMDKHERYSSASLYYPPARNEAFKFLRRIGCALKEA